MATQVQTRRGTTAEHSTFTGANGELTVDTTKKTVVVHDGTTAGGVPLAKESALGSYAPLASPTFTGQPYVNGSYQGNVTTVAALDIDCSTGNYFVKTVSGSSTFTVSNVPASRSYSFTLELTHTSGTITWFSGVIWPGGTVPGYVSGKTHLFMFSTDDGGTIWRGSALINYAS